MAKIVSNEMLKDILANSPTSYFKHTEEIGEIEVVFTGEICKVEPGEEDVEGRLWNPPIVDKVTGEPYKDFKGNPRQPWAKFEALCLINGQPNVYPFGAGNSSILRAFIAGMTKAGIENITGTKWSINRTGRWDWIINYLGKEDVGSSPTSSTTVTLVEKKEVDVSDPVKKTLLDFKATRPDKARAGIGKNFMLQNVVFETEMKPVDVESKFKELEKEGFLSFKDGNLIVING
jgi:hypothetical protein